jgi:hypothetical protein
MVSEEEEIIKKNISRFFVPISYEVNNVERWVKVLGEVTTLVGQEKVSILRSQFYIKYQVISGRLFIEELTEEKVHG